MSSNPQASPSPNFLIRDGLESDIDACLGLDHRYETNYVWQMQMGREEQGDQWNITLRMERLPRTMELLYPADEHRLRTVLPKDHCFLVAVGRSSAPAATVESPEDDLLASPANLNQVFGYLGMYHDRAYQIGVIYDLIVSRPYRGRQIGSRLLNVAKRWAKERGIVRLTIQTQTKNYPGIRFCQTQGFTFCGFNDRYYTNQDIAVFFSQTVR